MDVPLRRSFRGLRAFVWPEKATPARAGFPAENKSSGKSWIPRFSASSYLGITYSTYINTRHGVTARLRVNPVAQRELHVDQSMLACFVASRGLSSSSALLASVALLWAFYHERLHGFEGGVELVHARHPGELRLLTDAHTKHTG